MRALIVTPLLFASLALSGAARAEESTEKKGTATATTATARTTKPSAEQAVVAATGGGLPVTSRPYYVRGVMQFRTLPGSIYTDPNAVVPDELKLNDPAAGRSIIYSVEVGYKPMQGLALFARTGLLQRFIAEQGEGDFLIRDSAVGGRYVWNVPLAGLGLGERSLTLVHGLSVFLPTSRVSQAQDLYLAPEATTRLRLPIIEGLYASIDGTFQYRWTKYAERAGTAGGMNTQLMVSGGLGLGYTIEAGSMGVFDLGGGINAATFKKYASRDDFASASSDQEFWNQSFGWNAYAYYAPVAELGFVASLEQGANILRDGITRWNYRREDTEIVLSAIVQY